MAANDITDRDLDLDTEDATTQSAPKKGGVLKIVAILFGGLLIVATAVGVTLLILDSGESDPGFDIGDAVANPTIDSLAKGSKTGKRKTNKKKAKKTAKKKQPTRPAVYLPLDPAFTVNFESAGNVHYLQISMEVMARDPLVIEGVKNHLPLIRNNILLLLSDLSYEKISSREAKEKLRTSTLEVIKQSLRKETKNSQVEDVYFTSFVMQ